MSEAAKPGPDEVLRSRRFVPLLVMCAIVGVPVSVFAYFFLKAVTQIQTWLFTNVPGHFTGTLHTWWPVIPLAASGLIVGTIAAKAPGGGGEEPIQGFKAGGSVPKPSYLWGVAIAALVSIGFGAVVGPEGPLIALGGGLAYTIVSVLRKLAPNARKLIAAAGSFSSISTLLGSPLTGAFLLMEASGLSGLMLEVALLPGILAAGIGYLIFVGLDKLTGYGLFTLAIPGLPGFGSPTIPQIGWAIIAGICMPIAAAGIRFIGQRWLSVLRKHIVMFTIAAGVITGLLAVAFTRITGQADAYVLFSGQDQMPLLVRSAAGLTTGTVLLILLFKAVAYGLALASFRGGPTFPAIFLGCAFGVLLAHVFHLDLVAGIAICMGALVSSMLRLPLTSILLVTLLLGSDGVRVMPLTIVAAVLAYVIGSRLARGTAQTQNSNSR
ncbi:MAG TPA: chloride channel protein [Candidatus Saccharimonadales bacterium]|jgi:H+/Cl- antiporter ClcA